MVKPYFYYTSVALAGAIGFSLGGTLSQPTVHNQTLKMCNEKPLECKFKYDILMYNETGKVPYKEQPKQDKK